MSLSLLGQRGRLTQPHVGLIAALAGDFWRLARLTLDPAVVVALEEDCLREGLRVPGRPFPLPDGEAPPFRRVLALAERRVGRPALRRLGFACGGSVARAFEANVLSPNEGAIRMLAAFEKACGASGWNAKTEGAGSLSLSLAFDPPSTAAFAAFVAGFVKGAATRLNEGVVPLVRTRAEGPQAFSATLDWGPPAAPPALKGGRRTRRTR